MPLSDPAQERKVYTEKKKFRIWLIGNPDELGFVEGKDAVGQPKREHWYSAIVLSYMMIYHSLPPDEVFAGAGMQWIGNTFYYEESFPMGMTFTKDYSVFLSAVKTAEKIHLAIDELKELGHEIIEDFAIPKQGTPERVLFDRMVLVYEAWIKRGEERSNKIQEHVQAILNEVKR